MAKPDPVAIRGQLDRIVSSAAFAGSDRMIRLLRYVVERSLAGEADQLKEYVLGVEVFDRDERYDPRVDSIVRVEARRLRSKLEEYYAGAGAADAVIVQIPKGSYVPIFEPRPEAPPASAAVSPAVLPPPAAQALSPTTAHASLKGRAAAAALAAAVLALVVGAAWHEPATAPADVQASAKVSIAVLPFASFSGDAGEQQVAARLTDGVTTELARLGVLSVVSHTSAQQFAGARPPLGDIARRLGADAVLEASITVEADAVVVESRLVNASTDRKVWVQTFEGKVREIRAMQRQIAATVSPVAAGIPRQPQ